MNKIFTRIYGKFWYYIILVLIFVLGILIRTNLYFLTSVFEDDECRLAIALLEAKIYLALFLPLDAGQSAPPIFTICSKFLGDISGYSEKALTLIPFLSGIASIFLFFKICNDYFSKKLSIFISLFLFAINQQFITYSVIFKQYSTDVLTGLLCLYVFPKINLSVLNWKKFILISILLITLPLISLPSIFFIGAFILTNIINNIKNKNFYKNLAGIVLSFIAIMSLYYVFNLQPSKINMDFIFPNYWDDGFWKFSFVDFIRIIGFNIRFDFIPNKATLFTLILFLWGMIGCGFDKSKNRNTSLLMLFTFLGVLTASLLHIYPFAGRVGIFFAPIFIITIIRPFDTSTFPKPTYWITLLFIILSFYKYSPAYILNYKDDTTIVRYSPKSLMKELKQQFNPDEDIILINSASSASYLFYSSKQKFYTDKTYIMEIKPSERKEAFRYLDNLDKNQKYWLYLIKDYRLDPVFPLIEEWLKDKKVLYKKQERDSYLIHVQN